MKFNIKNALKLEEVGYFILATFAYLYFGGTPLTFALLILLPDLSMAGYLINPVVGAYTYNVVHHKALSILIFIIGIYIGNQTLILLSTILFAHSSLDRAAGYGLKYKDSFFNTHLGRINKK
jgi:hypothetical protein